MSETERPTPSKNANGFVATESPKKDDSNNFMFRSTSNIFSASSSESSKRACSPPTLLVPPTSPEQNMLSNSNSCPTMPTDHFQRTSRRVTVGICAMDKKSRSNPMKEILSRFSSAKFEITIFGNNTILKEPVKSWPIVDVLIAFYSDGYPLEKAEEYVKLRRPFVLNDLEMQRTLMDRRKVYDLLEESGIPVPRHVYMSRDGHVSNGSGAGNGDLDPELIEHDDYIEVNGVVMNKPFLEKPVDADDHNISIYYPTSAGGGCKKLFRKIKNRSSEFYPDINNVRRNGSFIYEEFVETQGTDVKMYTVGPDYGHAEARKSPAVDGKVERDPDGKEIRFPVILTLREKEIARRIVLRFKQQVCGFDLLRVQEEDSLVSYVCDVNGWSFVKNSRKYYDDCAQILTEHMLAAAKPSLFRLFSTLNPLMTTTIDYTQKKKASYDPLDTPPSDATTLIDGAYPIRDIPDALAQQPASLSVSAASSTIDENETIGVSPVHSSASSAHPEMHQEELRCIIAVVRHGDRTPKQKLKIKTSESHILSFYHQRAKNCRKDLKVKDKKSMIHFLQTTKTVVTEKKEQIKELITGLNKCETKEERENRKNMLLKQQDLFYKLQHMRDVLERWRITGLNRKLQMKPTKWEEIPVENSDDGVETNSKSRLRCTELLVILKWGGNLTKLGEKQAITLGKHLRHEMYPDSTQGGILRLHSTFRHDLKIKTSDEGRVMKTAAAFAKGLLELEGEIPPILVSLVHKEKGSKHMLDPSGNKVVKKELEQCKEKANAKLQKDFEYNELSMKQREDILGSTSLKSLHDSLEKIGNPRKALHKIHELMGELIEQLDEMLGLMTSADEDRDEGGEGLRGNGEDILSGIKLYKGETLLELAERWRFIYNKLYDEEGDSFDLSRIPDVHDNVRFDMLHNPHLGLTSTLNKLYELAKLMADCVVPQEYGVSVMEKRDIGNKMCHALLAKIKDDLIIARTDDKVDMRYLINMDYSADLNVNSLGRRVRTRLYFTSESHLHTLLNVLRFQSPGKGTEDSPLSKHGRDIIGMTPELCYLTQVIIRLFEDPRKELDDPNRFRVEIMFSPGATSTPLHMAEMYRELDSSRFDTKGLEPIGRDGLTCQEMEDYFEESIAHGRVVESDDEEVFPDKKKELGKVKKKPMNNSVSEKPGELSQASALDIAKGDAILIPPKINGDGKHGLVSPENAVGDIEGDTKKGKTGTNIEVSLPLTVVSDSLHTGVLTPNASREDEGDVHSMTNSIDIVLNDKKFPSEDDSSCLDGRKSPDDDLVMKEKVEKLAKILARRYMWRGIAAGCFCLGVGCLVLAKRLQDDFGVNKKTWTRR